MEDNEPIEPTDGAGFYDDEEDEGDFTPAPPASPEQQYSDTVSRITWALEQHDRIYPQLIASVEPFDKKLAQKIRESAKADAALMTYLKQKAEKNEHPSLVSRLFALLGGK